MSCVKKRQNRENRKKPQKITKRLRLKDTFTSLFDAAKIAQITLKMEQIQAELELESKSNELEKSICIFKTNS